MHPYFIFCCGGVGSVFTLSCCRVRPKLLLQYAMREAQKPFMGAIQNAFMMWMSGSHITIWSMMMTSMGIFNPLSSIASVNTYFKRVCGGPATLSTARLLVAVSRRAAHAQTPGCARAYVRPLLLLLPSPLVELPPPFSSRTARRT